MKNTEQEIFKWWIKEVVEISRYSPLTLNRDKIVYGLDHARYAVLKKDAGSRGGVRGWLLELKPEIFSQKPKIKFYFWSWKKPLRNTLQYQSPPQRKQLHKVDPWRRHAVTASVACLLGDVMSIKGLHEKTVAYMDNGNAFKQKAQVYNNSCDKTDQDAGLWILF